MKKFLNWLWIGFVYRLEGIFHLLYPKLCLACNQKEPMPKKWYCYPCHRKIPKTDQYLHKENPFTNRIYGRFEFVAAAAYYWFTKGGRAQKVVHNLKYKSRYQIGEIIGEEFGKKLKESPLFQNIDLIVPVPLHWKKLRKRGYNQSEVFAQGLSVAMRIPYLGDALIRNENSKSQTKKGKFDRLENVDRKFEVKKIKELEGKHILLVDDVLTTGATLEACAIPILELQNTKISLATIAIVKK